MLRRVMVRKLPIIAALIAAFLAPTSFAQDDKDKEKGPPPRPPILFVFAPDMNNKPLEAQYEKMQKEADAMDAADLHTIFVIGDRQVRLPPPDSRMEDAAAIRKRYHIDNDAFKMVLLGENGWEKKRWSEPTDPHVIVGYTHELPSQKDTDAK